MRKAWWQSIRKKIALLMSVLIILTAVPLEGLSFLMSHAVQVGTDASSNPIDVTDIEFVKNHSAFSVSGAVLQVFGSNLSSVNILFEFPGVGFVAAGTKSGDSDSGFLKYTLTDTEAQNFSGRIRIASTTVSLITSSFPYIQSANKLVVNQDDSDTIVFSGSNLSHISDAGVTAQYGRGLSMTTFSPIPVSNDAQVTLQPSALEALGYQDIVINKDSVTPQGINSTVKYNYTSSFRIIKDLTLTNLSMFPNAAAKGDSIYFTADDFNDSKTYEVYFLAPGENYTSYNKSSSAVLSPDKSKLTVQVPDNATITLGTKNVVITEVQSGQIIAEYAVADTFNLIDASYNPVITRVNPDSGPDTGSAVQIKGRNILSLSLPNLTGYDGIDSVDYSSGDKQMDVTYLTGDPTFTYQGTTVTAATRTVKTIIGKETFFERDSGNVKYSAGADDYVYVVTDSIADAATDPQKDVIMELTTVITVQGGATYNYDQRVVVTDGYTFIASSLEPTVTKVNPEKIQITAINNIKENTLISIEGDNFLVNKWTDGTGKVHVNYPVVLIQNSAALGDADFVLLFDKNGDPASYDGRIYYDSDYGNVLLDGATPVAVDMVVLNDNNEVVDGTVGNEVGTRIVLYLPKLASVDAGGKKNVQIINPKRDSDELGDEGIALDILDFVQATDTPVIESVSPNIVTVDGGEDVTVTGTNFQEGIKVFIDGQEISGVTRTVDVQGNKINLKFKAPEGRLGKTQLELLNPLGGLAVRDFYYVLSYNKDPEITKISPDKGTVDTLVVIEGDNFFKPDPTVQSDSGMDAFRLVGSRVYLDGKDVNTYNKDAFDAIDFVNYTAPDPEVLFTADAVNNRVRTSTLYRNATITNGASVYQLAFDANQNPVFYNGDAIAYSLKMSGGVIHGYDADDTDLGAAAIAVDSITFGAVTLDVEMDNNIFHIGLDADGNKIPKLADYWRGVVFEGASGSEYYTVEEQLDGTLRLSNGQLSKYTVELNDTQDGFKAIRDGGGEVDLTVNAGTLIVDPTGVPETLTMKTPYVFNGSRIITGNRAKVISKTQMIFTVPLLTTGQGYKDVTVENPDTKRDTVEKGFYYYSNPATKPVISAVVPNKGSVAGGYLITIIGKEFEDTSRVFIDGVEVADADSTVDLTGTVLTVKVPKYSKNLADYGTDRITVPVVVLNLDGGTASKEDGFMYINPASTPQINSIVTSSGSTVGGEIVEIFGYDFRYFEPYKDTTGGAGYDVGDEYTNLNGHLAVVKKWDNLLSSYMDGAIDLREPLAFDNGATYSFYSQHYTSPILPKVYFGTKQAQVVDFATGYIKVVTPPNTAGPKDIYIVNNDSGVSNKKTYTYESSSPKITYINPSQGARVGQQSRDLYGERFSQYLLPGYTGDDDTAYQNQMPGVEALVRFADITNRSIAVGQANDGRINAQRATVGLEGNMSVEYRGDLDQVTISVIENGNTYTRTFSDYDDEKLFIPVGMLKSGALYYTPNGYNNDGTAYNSDTDYELVLVEVDPVAKRFYVERGYAPATELDSSGHIVLDTPSYYTIGKVNVTLTNPDGGVAKTTFEYRNPASNPTIQLINPYKQITDENAWMVEATIKGGVTIEIKGTDFRDGVKVYLDKTPMEVVDITYDDVNDLEVIIAKVPAGADTDIDKRFSVIIENTDGGIANSTDPDNLTSTDKWPIYFIYRKPLSDPVIDTVTPSSTSQYGGNEIVITGTDFRAGAMVIIGSKGGVPVTPSYIEDRGRVIKFTTPTNLTVGPKDIQVINSDYGTGTKTSALTVVSYPILDEIRSEDGSGSIDFVSVEGGGKIRLYGSNFATGAKVLFGGTRAESTAATTTGEVGLWRNDKYYSLTDGAPAQSVEFIDSGTLLVTVPQVFKEKEYTITIINSDTGISDGDKTIEYNVPIPAAPVDLKAEVVNNRYIKLYDYTASNYDYFEIYVYIGDMSVADLKDNDYKDFKYLATAQTEPYKVTRLDAMEDMKSNERIYFVIKAVNKYGPSDWSNIASIKYLEVKHIEGPLGAEDFDGSLDVPKGQAYATNVNQQEAVVNLSKTDLKYGVNIAMNTSAFANVQQYIVNVPEAIVPSNYSAVSLMMKQGRLQFTPAVFNTGSFRKIADNDGVDTYGNLMFSPVANEYYGMIQRYIPRSLKAVSPAYQLDFGAKSNLGGTPLYEINGAVQLSLAYSDLQAGMTQPASMKIYYYNSSSSQWVFQGGIVDYSNGMVTTQVSRPGIYILLGTR